MPITNTQEIYEIRSISPVHINPSIMEGEQQLTSIIGPDRGQPIIRYAPIWLTVPEIEGDAGIPNTMFCTPGTVDASPAPNRTYHFYLDGVSAQNSTSPYFLTDSFMDSKDLTCTVTATNQLGSASATTAPVFVSLIEPVIFGEYTTFAITGLPVEDHITHLMHEIAVVTGMWVDDHVTTFQTDTFAITGLGLMDHVGISLFDTYSGEFMEDLTTITPTNGGAESGIGSWTVTGGTLQSVTVTPATGTTGTQAFRGPNVISTSCFFSQTEDISASFDDEIDTGNCYASMIFYTAREGSTGYDATVSGYYELYDGSDVLLGTYDAYPNFLPDNLDDINNWTYLVSPPEIVPVGTRKVRFCFNLPGVAVSGIGNICLIDHISLKLMQVNT
jgi:hypothetical protein